MWKYLTVVMKKLVATDARDKSPDGLRDDFFLGSAQDGGQEGYIGAHYKSAAHLKRPELGFCSSTDDICPVGGKTTSAFNGVYGYFDVQSKHFAEDCTVEGEASDPKNSMFHLGQDRQAVVVESVDANEVTACKSKRGPRRIFVGQGKSFATGNFSDRLGGAIYKLVHAVSGRHGVGTIISVGNPQEGASYKYPNFFNIGGGRYTSVPDTRFEKDGQPFLASVQMFDLSTRQEVPFVAQKPGIEANRFGLRLSVVPLDAGGQPIEVDRKVAEFEECHIANASDNEPVKMTNPGALVEIFCRSNMLIHCSAGAQRSVQIAYSRALFVMLVNNGGKLSREEFDNILREIRGEFGAGTVGRTAAFQLAQLPAALIYAYQLAVDVYNAFKALPDAEQAQLTSDWTDPTHPVADWAQAVNPSTYAPPRPPKAVAAPARLQGADGAAAAPPPPPPPPIPEDEEVDAAPTTTTATGPAAGGLPAGPKRKGAGSAAVAPPAPPSSGPPLAPPPPPPSGSHLDSAVDGMAKRPGVPAGAPPARPKVAPPPPPPRSNPPVAASSGDPSAASAASSALAAAAPVSSPVAATTTTTAAAAAAAASPNTGPKVSSLSLGGSRSPSAEAQVINSGIAKVLQQLGSEERFDSIVEVQVDKSKIGKKYGSVTILKADKLTSDENKAVKALANFVEEVLKMSAISSGKDGHEASLAPPDLIASLMGRLVHKIESETNKTVKAYFNQAKGSGNAWDTYNLFVLFLDAVLVHAKRISTSTKAPIGRANLVFTAFNTAFRTHRSAAATEFSPDQFRLDAIRRILGSFGLSVMAVKGSDDLVFVYKHTDNSFSSAWRVDFNSKSNRRYPCVENVLLLDDYEDVSLAVGDEVANDAALEAHMAAGGDRAEGAEAWRSLTAGAGVFTPASPGRTPIATSSPLGVHFGLADDADGPGKGAGPAPAFDESALSSFGSPGSGAGAAVHAPSAAPGSGKLRLASVPEGSDEDDSARIGSGARPATRNAWDTATVSNDEEDDSAADVKASGPRFRAFGSSRPLGAVSSTAVGAVADSEDDDEDVGVVQNGRAVFDQLCRRLTPKHDVPTDLILDSFARHNGDLKLTRQEMTQFVGIFDRFFTFLTTQKEREPRDVSDQTTHVEFKLQAMLVAVYGENADVHLEVTEVDKFILQFAQLLAMYQIAVHSNPSELQPILDVHQRFVPTAPPQGSPGKRGAYGAFMDLRSPLEKASGARELQFGANGSPTRVQTSADGQLPHFSEVKTRLLSGYFRVNAENIDDSETYVVFKSQKVTNGALSLVGGVPESVELDFDEVRLAGGKITVKFADKADRGNDEEHWSDDESAGGSKAASRAASRAGAAGELQPPLTGELGRRSSSVGHGVRRSTATRVETKGKAVVGADGEPNEKAFSELMLEIADLDSKPPADLGSTTSFIQVGPTRTGEAAEMIDGLISRGRVGAHSSEHKALANLLKGLQLEGYFLATKLDASPQDKAKNLEILASLWQAGAVNGRSLLQQMFSVGVREPEVDEGSPSIAIYEPRFVLNVICALAIQAASLHKKFRSEDGLKGANLILYRASSGHTFNELCDSVALNLFGLRIRRAEPGPRLIFHDSELREIRVTGRNERVELIRGRHQEGDLALFFPPAAPTAAAPATAASAAGPASTGRKGPVVAAKPKSKDTGLGGGSPASGSAALKAATTTKHFGPPSVAPPSGPPSFAPPPPPPPPMVGLPSALGSVGSAASAAGSGPRKLTVVPMRDEADDASAVAGAPLGAPTTTTTSTPAVAKGPGLGSAAPLTAGTFPQPSVAPTTLAASGPFAGVGAGTGAGTGLPKGPVMKKAPAHLPPPPAPPPSSAAPAGPSLLPTSTPSAVAPGVMLGSSAVMPSSSNSNVAFGGSPAASAAVDPLTLFGGVSGHSGTAPATAASASSASARRQLASAAAAYELPGGAYDSPHAFLSSRIRGAHNAWSATEGDEFDEFGLEPRDQSQMNLRSRRAESGRQDAYPSAESRTRVPVHPSEGAQRATPGSDPARPLGHSRSRAVAPAGPSASRAAAPVSRSFASVQEAMAADSRVRRAPAPLTATLGVDRLVVGSLGQDAPIAPFEHVFNIAAQVGGLILGRQLGRISPEELIQVLQRRQMQIEAELKHGLDPAEKDICAIYLHRHSGDRNAVALVKERIIVMALSFALTDSLKLQGRNPAEVIRRCTIELWVAKQIAALSDGDCASPNLYAHMRDNVKAWYDSEYPRGGGRNLGYYPEDFGGDA